jgi:hypothetical protein
MRCMPCSCAGAFTGKEGGILVLPGLAPSSKDFMVCGLGLSKTVASNLVKRGCVSTDVMNY